MNFSGKKWSEGFNFRYEGIANDDIMNDNLDLLIVPQYGRNPDHMG